MKRLYIVLLSITLFLGNFAQAQEIKELRHRPGQITLFSPLGTNGLKSGRTINHFSLNVLAGYSGGLQGMEVGGLANVIRYDMFGLQLAGLGNAVLGGMTGVQAAGLYNFARQSSEGGQLAGIVNFIGGGAYAYQGAGILNIVGRNGRGLQAGGIANFTGYTFTGAQFAGLINIAGREVRGAQISGLLNYTRKLNGVQIGFINVADTVASGIPIGFLSFVKDGYHQFEIGTSESLYATVSYKIGVQHFYNIFSVGAQWDNGPYKWAIGYGIGSEWNLGKKTSFNIDAISYHINEGEAWTDQLNLLNKLQLSMGWQIFQHLTLFGGVSLNVHVRDDETKGFNDFTSSFYQNDYYDTYVDVYPGFQAGIRFGRK